MVSTQHMGFCSQIILQSAKQQLQQIPPGEQLSQVDQGTHSRCNAESAVGQGQAAISRVIVRSRQSSCPRASPAGSYQAARTCAAMLVAQL